MGIVLSFLIAGCEKNNENGSKDLISKWIETEHYYSIGGPGEWHPTKASDAEIIELRMTTFFIAL